VSGQGAGGQAEVAETTDGGQTWTDLTPPQWNSSVISNAIDCVTATTCWVAGFTVDQMMNPWVTETTDGGKTWATFSNLPTFPPYDPNGTYTLSGISCTSALECVAVGGLNLSDGLAQVISTTDGGATWSLSADPNLTDIQDLFSVSCVPGTGGLPTCSAAGSALRAAGPVTVRSADGGATWTGMETYDTTGWMNSVSCADAQHCWAAGGGTSVALVGTSDGWATWSTFTAKTTNEDGSVSCASVRFCVSTADNAVRHTSTDGGLGR